LHSSWLWNQGVLLDLFLALGFRRRRAFTFVFIFLFLYPIITGLGSSVIRAAIMGSLSFLAIYYQRSGSLIRALVFSAALMLVFNPQLLRHDIGFQLSFLALLGIIYIYPLGNSVINNILKKTKLKIKTKKIIKIILETFNLTLVAQIVILPVAVINFKQISLIAPLSNVLILWSFPFLLASLLGGLLLSALIPAGTVFWFMPAYFFLKYIFIVSSSLASLSWAALSWKNLNWSAGVCYYLLLILLV
jgi:competence protein ComEC